MKKIIIVSVLAMCLLLTACGGSAPAQPTAEPTPQATEAPAEENMDAAQPQEVLGAYVAYQGTVNNIADGIIETLIDPEAGDGMENIINYMVLEDTLFFNANGEAISLEDIKEGDLISAYVPTNSTAPMILPAQYQVKVIVVSDPEQAVSSFMNDFVEQDGMLVDSTNSLALNIAEETQILDITGQELKAEDLSGKDLLVFYNMSTMSIPAQTAPVKVIVIGETEVIAEPENLESEPAEAK